MSLASSRPNYFAYSSPSVFQDVEAVEIEYVSEKPDFADSNGHLNPLIEDFVRVFEKFTNAEELFPVARKVRCDTNAF